MENAAAVLFPIYHSGKGGKLQLLKYSMSVVFDHPKNVDEGIEKPGNMNIMHRTYEEGCGICGMT